MTVFSVVICHFFASDVDTCIEESFAHIKDCVPNESVAVEIWPYLRMPIQDMPLLLSQQRSTLTFRF
jgi:hypothetical protein